MGDAEKREEELHLRLQSMESELETYKKLFLSLKSQPPPNTLPQHENQIPASTTQSQQMPAPPDEFTNFSLPQASSPNYYQQLVNYAINGIGALQEKTRKMEFDVCEAFKKIRDNAFEVNAQEQYLKKFDLLARALPNLPDPKVVGGFEYTNKIIDIINNLPLELQQPLRPEHVSTAHILPTQVGKPSCVIIRFNSLDMRNEIFYKKRKLKGNEHRITISEHLTKYNQEVYNAAFDVAGRGNVWTSKCKIFMMYNGKKHHVKNLPHLKFLAPGKKLKLDENNGYDFPSFSHHTTFSKPTFSYNNSSFPHMQGYAGTYQLNPGNNSRQVQRGGMSFAQS